MALNTGAFFDGVRGAVGKGKYAAERLYHDKGFDPHMGASLGAQEAANTAKQVGSNYGQFASGLAEKHPLATAGIGAAALAGAAAAKEDPYEDTEYEATYDPETGEPIIVFNSGGRRQIASRTGSGMDPEQFDQLWGTLAEGDVEMQARPQGGSDGAAAALGALGLGALAMHPAGRAAGRWLGGKARSGVEGIRSAVDQKGRTYKHLFGETFKPRADEL